ncbi:FtsX-like permease family protein [Lewinella sp. W8]|uniref:ABC transporter permease n=1 Tax=Lewinella sp. W8 TaxID=2528208 RepID=UPI001067AC48|nr:FtsX-like permease family protein [Lewinella sp. W8]MTB50112.1 FtsX-like permease family protein [Lewinella sp. W8]
MKDLRILLDVTRTHLLSRFKQTAIATLGVTFGIGTFIIMVSFMTGLNGLLDGLILNRTPHIQIYNEIKPSERQPVDLYEGFADNLNVVRSVKPRQTQERIHNGAAILNYLKGHDSVRGATSQVNARVFYLAGSIQLNGLVNGIDVNEEIRLFNFGDYIVRGSPEDLLRTRNGILLGAGVAGNMSVDVGDRIQVSTVAGGLFSLKIVGIFQSGLAEVDNVQSYVNLGTAQQLLGEGRDYVSNIHVKLYDIDEAGPMSRRISDQFDLTALDIQTANAQFETGTTIRNLITYAVSITLLIVAGFGIYNILNMLIYEKMNDIAILKAVGFTGRDINVIFISQALIIGLVGGLIGLVIGFGVSVLIDNTPFVTEALPTIKTYPVNFDPAYYIIGIVFAMISTFFAGFLPARRARKIDPVEIIRGQ